MAIGRNKSLVEPAPVATESGADNLDSPTGQAVTQSDYDELDGLLNRLQRLQREAQPPKPVLSPKTPKTVDQADGDPDERPQEPSSPTSARTSSSTRRSLASSLLGRLSISHSPADLQHQPGNRQSKALYSSDPPEIAASPTSIGRSSGSTTLYQHLNLVGQVTQLRRGNNAFAATADGNDRVFEDSLEDTCGTPASESYQFPDDLLQEQFELLDASDVIQTRVHGQVHRLRKTKRDGSTTSWSLRRSRVSSLTDSTHQAQDLLDTANLNHSVSSIAIQSPTLGPPRLQAREDRYGPSSYHTRRRSLPLHLKIQFPSDDTEDLSAKDFVEKAVNLSTEAEGSDTQTEDGKDFLDRDEPVDMKRGGLDVGISSSQSCSSLSTRSSGRTGSSRKMSADIGRMQPRSPFAVETRQFRPHQVSRAETPPHASYSVSEHEDTESPAKASGGEGGSARRRRTIIGAAQALQDTGLGIANMMRRKSSRDSVSSNASISTGSSQPPPVPYNSHLHFPEVGRDSLDSKASGSLKSNIIQGDQSLPRGYSPVPDPSTSNSVYAGSEPARTNGSEYLPIRRTKQSTGSHATNPSITSSERATYLASSGRLQARDEREYYTRPRFTSARSASSMSFYSDDDDEAGGSIAELPTQSERSYSQAVDLHIRRPEESVLPIAAAPYARRASETPALHANRPPATGSTSQNDGVLTRSQSYDVRLASQLISAQHVPESTIVQSVYIWLPADVSQQSTHKSGMLSRLLMSSGHSGRKKISKRESVQAFDTSSTLLHNGLDETVKKSSKGKEREEVSVFVPSGTWKRCDARLDNQGTLSLHTAQSCIISAAIAGVRRTDIRQCDHSVLGRSHCLSIMLASNDATAADASELSTQTPTSRTTSRRGSLANETSIIYLAFNDLYSMQAYISALHAWAQPEIYPNSVHRYPADCDAEIIGDPTYDISGRTVTPRIDRNAGVRPAHRRHDSLAERALRPWRTISLQFGELRSSQVSQRDGGHVSHIAAMLAGGVASLGLNSDGRKAASLNSGSASTHSLEETSSIHKGPSTPSLSSSVSAASSLSQSNVPSQAVSNSPSYSRRILPDHILRDRDKDKGDKEKYREYAYIEVSLHSEILARSTAVPFGTAMVWHERYTLENVGILRQPLIISIYRLSRGQSSLMGYIDVAVHVMKRGTAVDGWYPVHSGDLAKDGHLVTLQEMSMCIKVQEAMILQAQEYALLEQTLISDTGQAIRDLQRTHHIDPDDLAARLVRIDIARERALVRLKRFAQEEVRRSDADVTTLFRGNSLFTKAVEHFMRITGSIFLEGALADVVKRLSRENIDAEIDPERLLSHHPDALSENILRLNEWTRIFWEAIYNARDRCPWELRVLFRDIRRSVEDGLSSNLSAVDARRAGLTGVSAFVFLRFLVPAVLNPRPFGHAAAHPPAPQAQRTLTLIAKTLQGLANMTLFGGKEPWMAVMNPFLQDNRSAFDDFIVSLCAPSDDSQIEDHGSKTYGLYRKATRLREQQLAPMIQEGIASLPYLVDLPRELALLATLIADARPQAAHGTNSRSMQNGSGEALRTMCLGVRKRTRDAIRMLEDGGHLALVGGLAGQRSMVARQAQYSIRDLPNRPRGLTVSQDTSEITPSASNTRTSALDGLHSLIPTPTHAHRTKRRSHTVSAVKADRLAEAAALDGADLHIRLSSSPPCLHGQTFTTSRPSLISAQSANAAVQRVR